MFHNINYLTNFMKKIEPYTTYQLLKLLSDESDYEYKTTKTLLHALYNNQKADKDKKNKFLSSIWKASYKFRSKRYYKKDKINLILGGK